MVLDCRLTIYCGFSNQAKIATQQSTTNQQSKISKSPIELRRQRFAPRLIAHGTRINPKTNAIAVMATEAPPCGLERHGGRSYPIL
jgi:hypothetical protein